MINLSEIAENNRNYDQRVVAQVNVAEKLYGIFLTLGSVTQRLAEADQERFLKCAVTKCRSSWNTIRLSDDCCTNACSNGHSRYTEPTLAPIIKRRV